MFFKKKIKPSDEHGEYFRYRDSLTGCMNKTRAIKEFEKHKGNPDMGGVLIRLRCADEMAVYKGERLIKETAVIITNIFKGDVFRLEMGDFLVFTTGCESMADKINYFLSALSDDEERRYAVAAMKFDKNEKDYSVFMHRLYRGVRIAEGINGKSAIY